MRKLLPPSYLFIYLLLGFALHIIFPIKNFSSVYRILGIIPIIFGVTINLWADNLFKKKQTTVKPDKTPTFLIIDWPFSFSRHPMYLGFVLILLGVSITLGSLSSFISPMLMFITLERKFIPLEEQQMEEIFGNKYREYQKKVSRWI